MSESKKLVVTESDGKVDWSDVIIEIDGESCTLEQVFGAFKSAKQERDQLRVAICKSSDEIERVLGKALGYPWYKDDQENFPGATELNGVCVGDHVVESIAAEAANRISQLTADLKKARDALEKIATANHWAAQMVVYAKQALAQITREETSTSEPTEKSTQ